MYDKFAVAEAVSSIACYFIIPFQVEVEQKLKQSNPPKNFHLLNLLHVIFRTLEFVQVFLETVLSGEEDLVKCAQKAYDDVLKQFHGWIIRGIFYVRHLRLSSLV